MRKALKRLISLSSIYALGSLSENALSFFLIPLYTALLIPEDFGIIGLMTITVSLLITFISGPLNNSLLRFYYAPEYKQKNDVLLFNLVIVSLFFSCIIAIFFWLLSSMIAKIILNNPTQITIVHWYALILLFQPTHTLFLSMLRQQERAKYFVFNSLTTLVIKVSVILYLLLHLHLGVLALVIGEFVGVMLSVLIISPIFVKTSHFEFNLKILKEPLTYGYQLIISPFSNTIIQSGDRYVMKIFNSLDTVGLYTFGYNFASVINILIIVPIKQAIFPIVLKQENDPEKLKNFLRKSTTYYYFGSVFICLILSLFSYEMMSIMVSNKAFLASVVIVPILAFSYVQHGLGNFVVWGLAIKKKGFHESGIVLLIATINIALNFVFIPIWGVVGAAFATLIAYFIWNAIKMYYTKKFLNLDFEVTRLVLITIVGIGLYLLSCLSIFNTANILLNIGLKMLLLLLYPLLFLLTGFFSRREIEWALHIFKKMRAFGITASIKELYQDDDCEDNNEFNKTITTSKVSDVPSDHNKNNNPMQGGKH